MRLTFAACLMMVFFTGKLFPQIPLWQWAVQIASPGDEIGEDVCVSSSGGVFVCGSYDGNLGGLLGLPFFTANQKDGFIAKYSQTGNLQMAFRLAGVQDDVITGISVDALDNIYVTGYFQATCDFDPALLFTHNLVSAGGTDGFVAKYSPTGNLLWVTRFGGAGNDKGYSVVVSGQGIYISGESMSGATFYSTNSTTMAVPGNEQQTNFVGARYNSSGVLQWVVSAGGSGPDAGKDLTADQNAIYYTGTYQGSLSVYTSSGTPATTLAASNSTSTEVFVLAYSTGGGLLWATNAASTEEDLGYGITQDNANIYIAGGFKGAVLNLPYPSPTHSISNMGGYDFYLASISKLNGSYNWVSSQTGSGVGDEIAYTLECDANGHIVLGGGFNGNVSFTAAGGPTLNTAGGDDILVSSFSNSGNFLWCTHAGGNNPDRAYGIGRLPNGAVFVCGESADGVSFGGITLPSLNGKNAFLAKTGCEGVSNNSVSGTQTICAGTVPATLQGSLPAGTGTISYVWQQSITTTGWMPAPGTNTNQFYVSPPLNNTAYFRRVVYASGTCPFPGNTLTVTVDQQPGVAIAGPSQTICSSTATLNATTPVTGTGQWSLVSGSLSVINFTNTASELTNIAAGTHTLAWTLSNGVCAPDISTLTIHRDLLPGPLGAGPSQTVCATAATLAAISLSAGTGTWSLVSGTATLSGAGNPSATVSNLSAGANIFLWTISNGVCPVASMSTTVHRDLMPSPAVTAASQSICTSAATLTATNPGTGTGSWSVIAGGSTLSSVSGTQVTVTGLLTGTHVFGWTVSNGVCPVSTATTSITRDPVPDVSVAGASQSVCGTSATLAGNAPQTGNGTWSVVSGNGVFSAVQQNNATVNSLLPGLNVFMWTIQNGVCPPSVSTTSVTGFTLPGNVSAGLSQTICAPSTTLNAGIPSAGTGSWSVLSSPASISSPHSNNTAVNALGTGSNTFIWTVVNGVCPVSTSSVQIVRDSFPTVADAGLPFSVCNDSIHLNANIPVTGTGAWLVLAGGSQIVSPTSYSALSTGLSIGSNIYEWTISNGVCPPSVSTVIVNRDAEPSPAVAGVSQTVCSSETHLSAMVPSVGTGSWVSLGAAVTENASDASGKVSDLSAGDNFFVWTVGNGVCPAETDTIVVFKETPPSEAVAGPDLEVCSAQTTLSAIVPLTGTGSWVVQAGGGVVTQTASPVTSADLLPGKNLFVWEISSGICPPSRDTVVVIRHLEPDRAFAGNDQQICGTSVHLTGNNPLTGTPQWLSLNGAVTFSNPNWFTTDAASLNEGVHGFIYKISNGVCAPTEDTVLVKVWHIPGPVNAGSDKTICSDTTRMSATSLNVGTGTWSVVSGKGNFEFPGAENSILHNVAVGLNIYRWSVVHGVCDMQYDDIIIRRDIVTETAYAGPDIETELFSVRMQARPVKSSGRWEIISGEGTPDDPLDPYSLVTNLSPGRNVFRWTVSQGECSQTFDEIVVYLKEFIIPNALSPNGDGRNDVFYITGLENYSAVRLNIFNRWGNLVYATDDYQNDWRCINMRGEQLTDDTYFYVLEIPGKGSFSGSITVKR